MTDPMSKLIIENAILPAVPARRLPGRHQGRRARHQGRAARRRRSRQGARPGQRARATAPDTMSGHPARSSGSASCSIILWADASAPRRRRSSKPALPAARRAGGTVIIPGSSGGWGGGWSSGGEAAAAAGRAAAAISAAAARREAGRRAIAASGEQGDREHEPILRADEERRIADAITQAERKTSGEIVAVVAARATPISTCRRCRARSSRCSCRGR